MSITLTPEQARALRVARWALAADPDITDKATDRADALREVLQKIVDAFAEAAS